MAFIGNMKASLPSTWSHARADADTGSGCLMRAATESCACGVQAAGPKTWDEVMVVAYKSRWQFFRMALLTPTYWPLA